MLGHISAKFLRAYVSDETLILILLLILAIIVSLSIFAGIAKYLRRKRELANHHEKILAYKQSVAHNPNDSLTIFQLGMEYQALYQHREAIECFRQALVMNKDTQLFDDIHYNLGLSYVAIAEKDLAFAEYNQIQANSAKAQSLLMELMKIK
jgi:tetratricopeptide (TPR) repeat protein